MEQHFYQLILKLSSLRILYLPHAVKQMTRPDRMISTVDIRMALEAGEIIEYYPQDARGSSCLIFGRGERKTDSYCLCTEG